MVYTFLLSNIMIPIPTTVISHLYFIKSYVQHSAITILYNWQRVIIYLLSVNKLVYSCTTAPNK